MVLDELLSRACASIQSRIRREILREDPSSPEMAGLQVRILEDIPVKAIFQSQQADGWIGWSFHGVESMESAIRLLCEKDVDPARPAFSAALDALEQETSRLERGIGKAGRYLDEAGLGGQLTIRAALLAQAGYLWLAETGRVPAVADRVTLWVTAGLVVLLTAALAWSFVRRPRR